MSRTKTTEQVPSARVPATLGEVLYATGRAPQSEQDWVALVHAIAAGDQRSLRAIYERSHRIVYTLAVRITGSRETAEEVTVDVFHDVWRRAVGYDPANGTVVGWVMNQARSRAIDRLRFQQRKKRVNPFADETADEPAASDVYEMLERAEVQNTLREALLRLAPEERQAIETAYFSGLTYAEVAERLNAPLGTVKTRIRSGLAKLRTALRGNGKP
jgi:RNA polymerase sigma-70 factor, ECF subfamily